ncbi:universal stress protein [Deinococcus planocerae]|uniref:universal stress protein n=1 Tax=Deinococcus planocerae TaxID=1737569 RepID=UPI000C7F33E5|nr:universal stress protein [Deinococcus planocerae]
MTRVLVLMDFSPAALAALGAARDTFPDATPTVLHVVAPDTDPHPGGYAREHGQLGALGGGVVAVGRPAEEALRRAGTGEYDLIVMGTAGRRGVGRLLLGSVAERLLRESPVPVFSVRSPEGADHRPLGDGTWPHAARAVREGERPSLRRVLVLMDFSPSAHRALSFVRAHLPGTEVKLLHVVEPSALDAPFPLPTLSDPPLRGASARLLAERNSVWEREARRRLDELGGGEVVGGNPAQVALDRAAGGGYDLVAVGTAGRGGLSRLVVGSVALRLVRESPVPVLTARDVTPTGAVP